MSTTILGAKPVTQAGLGTLTFTAGSTSIHTVDVLCTMNEGVTGAGAGTGTNGPGQNSPTTTSSGVSLVINQNGTPIYTSPTITATQNQIKEKIQIACSSGDVLTIVTSSSNAIDKQLNTIQTTASIFIGT